VPRFISKGALVNVSVCLLTLFNISRMDDTGDDDASCLHGGRVVYRT
jgi:hypothetical protein